MILLGMDTCGSSGTLALARVLPVDLPGAGRELELLGSSELPGRSTAAMLVPQIGQMLLDCGVLMAEVTAVVVVDGPGSFTGIRIGISTAKALADARSIPLYAVSRLRVLAWASRLPCAVLDAGRGEYFFGAYPFADEPGLAAHPCGDPAGESQGEWLLTEAELRSRMASSEAQAAVCEQKVAAAFPLALPVAEPTAAEALRTALPAVLAGLSTEVAALDGRYLRRSDLYRTASGS